MDQLHTSSCRSSHTNHGHLVLLLDVRAPTRVSPFTRATSRSTIRSGVEGGGRGRQDDGWRGSAWACRRTLSSYAWRLHQHHAGGATGIQLRCWFIWVCHCACASCVAIPASPVFHAAWECERTLVTLLATLALFAIVTISRYRRGLCHDIAIKKSPRFEPYILPNNSSVTFHNKTFCSLSSEDISIFIGYRHHSPVRMSDDRHDNITQTVNMNCTIWLTDMTGMLLQIQTMIWEIISSLLLYFTAFYRIMVCQHLQH